MPNQAQRDYVFKQLGYNPTAEQLVIHNDPSRIRLITGGERSGKSYSAAMDLMSRFYEGELFWLVAADYARTRAEYMYLVDAFTKLGWEFTYTKRVDPGEIVIAGGFRIVTKSAKDPRKIAMEAPDGILACEASQLDYETYLKMRGRIAEKRGWLLMGGTLEGSLGWYPEHYKRWQVPNKDDAKAFSLPAWSNTYIYPGGRNDPEILSLEKSCSKDWFQERYAGVPVQIHGIVFPEFSNAIHTGTGAGFEFDPTKEVSLMVDPGYAHFYAVEATQKVGETIVVFDEIYETGFVTSDIIKICQQKPWWKNVKGGFIDIAGTQHQAMPAVSEIWRKEGKVSLRSNKVRIQDGVERIKTSLNVNPLTNKAGLLINLQCKGLISELGGCLNPKYGDTRVYRWKTDKSGNIVGDKPEDKNCDAIKATVYGLVGLLGYTPAQRRAKVKFF